MRRFLLLFVVLLAALTLPASMMADDSRIFNSAQNPVQPVKQVNQQLFTAGSTLRMYGAETKLKAEELPLSAKRQARKVKTSGAAKIDVSLSSECVITYKTLTSSGADGGNAVTVAVSKTAADSVTITNFFASGVVVKAKVDPSTSVVTIPNQVLGKFIVGTDTVPCDLAVITSAGKPDRKSQITGKKNADGSITLDSWWGVFVTTGTNADKFVGAYYNTEIIPANATMSYTVWNSHTSALQNVSFAVYVEQPTTNVIKVTNFANYGQTVEVELNRDCSATIESQVARKDATYGSWSTYSATFKENYAGLASYASVITCNKATDKRTVSWGNWTLLTSGYYWGAMTEGKIETKFDITYPQLNVTDLEGEGTEANPYKLKTLDDMILLSDKVNSEEATYGTTTLYARPYLGKYFRMENDIDMSGYRFTPIGADWTHQFAGTLDGNGHTITGLTVNTGAKGYAGLFGKVDTLGVIKNVKFDKAVVEAGSYYAAVVAAWSLGDIENCTVTNSVVTNTGNTGAAGIAAIVRSVSNCSVTTCNITGAYGYAGGVAGQVNGTASNCSAVNVSIKAGGVTDTYPSGGVIGSLFGGKAVNCYFSGTLDGRYQSNLSLGGVAGVCYKGTIEKCYATGTIYGYGNQATVGGVAGNLYGSIENCYSNTVITSVSSRYVGGLTGYVRSWKDGDNECQSSLKSSYSASVVDAETYQYKPETERREILGTVMDGATPVTENIYFDNQMTNFKSTEYGATTAQLTSASGVKGFDSTVWTFTEGAYPRLKGMDDTEAAKFSASALILSSRSSRDKVCQDAKFTLLGNTTVKYVVNGKYAEEGTNSSISGVDLKLKESFGSDSICFVSENVGLRVMTIKISPIDYDGEGTEDNPYLLKTKADLIKLSKATTISQQLFPDTYFKVANDIDLEKDDSFLGICASITTSSSDAHVQFAGHIDGGGHTIHNMNITGAIIWTTKPTETTMGTPTVGSCIGYKGFIGRLGPAGSVKNLTIAADATLTDFWATSAAIVGYNYGTIENCKNYADVTGLSCWIGGIAGQNLKGAIIRNCYNAGNITTGYMTVGGIAGSNYGLIENCENTGEIAAKVVSYFISGSKVTKLLGAGGISGGMTGGRIVNSVNSGTIYGYARVGGISGSLAAVSGSSYDYQNEVVNCINYGSVISTDKANVGSIGGQAGTTGECKDNYYDGQITLHKANGNADLQGTKAVETSVLTSGTALENYSTVLWAFEAGKYPVLKQFADEAAVKVARSLIVNVAAGETMSDLKNNVTLATVDGCTWTLKDGKAFSVANSKLAVPASVTTLVVDTLIGTCQSGMVKPFVVEARPAVPVTGKGTAADPYIIGTTDEWNAFAEFMATCSEPMTDKYVKLTADLDFTGKTIKPFSYDGVTPFNGTFDGNSKTVKAEYTASAEAEGILFRTVDADAYVHDITVEGKLTTALSKAGGMIGTLKGKLENATNRATVTAGTKSYVGGLVGVAGTGASLTKCVNEGEVSSAGTYASGLVSYSEAGVKYVNCGNTGKVTYTGTTGTTSKLIKTYLSGLIGYCNPDTLINCYNEGEVSATKPTTVSTISGLIGMATASSTSSPYYIKGCYNTADISSAANNAGLIIDTNANAVFHMEGCYNTGDVSSTATGTVSSTYTAGVSAFYTPNSVYRNCWNSGTILSQKPVYAAGLFCYYKGSGSAAKPFKFVGCYNKGDIVASGNQGGGIIAYGANYSVVDSCYNEGNIEGGFGLGGIVAAFPGANSTISNCWNSGDVTTTSYRAGGIIGFNANSNTVITNCFNVGNISTTATTAQNGYGIGGIAGHGGGYYKNVYSYGRIKGKARVGGLIGYSNVGSEKNGVVSGTRIEDSYFAGTVEAPADTCGMIIGVRMTENPKTWNNDYNYVKNVFYVKEFASEGVNNAGTASSLHNLITWEPISDSWTRCGDFCYPILKGFCNNDEAKVQSVSVLFDEEDTKTGVTTKDFRMGNPADVTITIDNADVEFDGNWVHFKKPYTGNVVFTVKSGEAVVNIEVQCKVTEISTGIDTSTTEANVVKTEYYTTSGVRVAEPKADGKSVYVVVKTYKDGSRKTVKEVK